MNPLAITSLKNDRVKNIVKLRERRHRDRQKLMLIEGYRSISRAFAAGVIATEAYFCRDFFLGENEIPLLEELEKAGAQLFEVSRPVFEKFSYRDRPEGLLIVAPYGSHSLEKIPQVENPLLVVAQSIEKPGNLGTIIRSADGTGADGLILCDRCTDLYNPNVITASTGIMFGLPIADASTEECLQYLKQHEITILSATPHAEKNYTDVDMTGPVAIIVGAEQYGLTEEWMQESSVNVRIPMMGNADSLNVATATTLLLYEALRQRQLRTTPGT